MAVVIFLFLLIFFGGTPSARAQVMHIHSGAGVSATQLPFWTAKHLGINAKYGITVELVAISSGARGMQALMGGSTQSANMAAMSPIRTVLAGGDVTIVAGYLNKSLFKLVAQKDIRKPADLIGKRIGLANFGGSTEFGVLMTLKELNISRDAFARWRVAGTTGRKSARRLRVSKTSILPGMTAPPSHEVRVRSAVLSRTTFLIARELLATWLSSILSEGGLMHTAS